MTLQIDSIGGIVVIDLQPRYQSVVNSYPVPGGRTQYGQAGVDALSLDVACQVRGASAPTVLNQILELVSNPDIQFHYLSFGTGLSQYDGWYELDGLPDLPLTNPGYVARVYPFTLSLHRVGTPGDSRPSLYWTASAETLTGAAWAGPPPLTSTVLVALPVGATNSSLAIYETRAASDGSVPVVHNPSDPTLFYTPSATLADWDKGNCRVYDSVTAGDTNEAHWLRVYGLAHAFTGDLIMQNGLLRYRIASRVGEFWMWDPGGSAWLSCGIFETQNAGPNYATPLQVQFTRLTPNEIRWTELRSTGSATNKLTYALRRGSYFCKVTLSTTDIAVATNGPWLVKGASGWYPSLFNSGTSSTASGGAGALTAPDTYNYAGAYFANAARPLVAGYVYYDYPAYQPGDGGSSELQTGMNLTLGLTRKLAVFAFPFDTTTLPTAINTARAKALNISQEALQLGVALDTLLPAGYYA